MIDFSLFGGFDNRQTDERTFVVVESLSRLKMSMSFEGLWVEILPSDF